MKISYSNVHAEMRKEIEDESQHHVEKLNRLLQELAWEAVTQHPLSGVRVEGNP